MAPQDDKNLFRTLFAPLYPLLGEIFASTLMINLLAFALPLFILQIYDRVIAQAGLSTLQGLVIGMCAVILFDFVLRQARAGLLQDAAMRIDASLAKQVFRKITNLPLRILENRPQTFWQSLFQDVDQIRTGLSGIGAIMVADLPFSLIGILLIALIAPPLAWALLIIVPLFILLTLMSNWSARRAAQEERGATLKRDALIDEMIADRTTIKALGLGRHLETIWQERQAGTIESAISRAAQADRYHNLSKSLLMGSTVTLTGFGALAIINQEMTIGALIAANMLMSRILQPLNMLVMQWKTIAGTRQSWSRLKMVLKYKEVPQTPTLKLDRPNGKLRFENILFHFGDEENKTIINNVTAYFGPKGLHGIVGANGSGKSTFLKLARGLYSPKSGRIFVDQGDLVQFSETECLRWFGYVPQQTRLLSGTIKDNLRMAQLEDNEDALISATKAIGLHDEILALKHGYATEVGEHGEFLSGGLKQRIAIARALVNNPVFLLMDEPTNNLDMAAQLRLVGLLQKLAETRTILCVSHSLNLLEKCASIMILEQGRIKAGGKASDILPTLKRMKS